MAFCTQQVLGMASGSYEDLNSPSSISVGYISGWITSSGGMLGDLGNRLSISLYLEGSDPCIAGGFEAAEQSIAGNMFKAEFYQKEALRALTSLSIPWTTIKDGDSTFSRESASNIAKTYMAMQKDIDEQIKIAVANWKRGASTVASVDAEQLYSWPSP
jgi:hypothetical protein